MQGVIDDLDDRNYPVDGCKFDAIEKIYEVPNYFPRNKSSQTSEEK